MKIELSKDQFCVAVNTRIRQLAKEIQNDARNFGLKKQKSPGYNNQNEQAAIVEKMEAVRDLSRIIKFYFKEKSEEDTKQCRDYTNMDFDGLNGWVSAYTDLSGENHPGKLSFWDPINNSAIDITEDKLANVDIPFLGHENQRSNCWFNAFNSMLSHIPNFYLYFLELGKMISNKSNNEKAGIKEKFRLSYEMAMYIKRVNDSQDKKEQYHETLDFVKQVTKILARSSSGIIKSGANDVDDYKQCQCMIEQLNNELDISVIKNLPQPGEKPNEHKHNGVSVYNAYNRPSSGLVYPSPISKTFYTDSVTLTACNNN